jgi:hypothetical protein
MVTRGILLAWRRRVSQQRGPSHTGFVSLTFGAIAQSGLECRNSSSTDFRPTRTVQWTKHADHARRSGRAWQYGVDAVRIERVVNNQRLVGGQPVRSASITALVRASSI